MDFEKRLIESVGYDTIQLVVISRPSAYGEYEPYYTSFYTHTYEASYLTDGHNNYYTEFQSGNDKHLTGNIHEHLDSFI